MTKGWLKALKPKARSRSMVVSLLVGDASRDLGWVCGDLMSPPGYAEGLRFLEASRVCHTGKSDAVALWYYHAT
jgi:hypothetical protein